jgi:hypothetical protein
VLKEPSSAERQVTWQVIMVLSAPSRDAQLATIKQTSIRTPNKTTDLIASLMDRVSSHPPTGGQIGQQKTPW